MQKDKPMCDDCQEALDRFIEFNEMNEKKAPKLTGLAAFGARNYAPPEPPSKTMADIEEDQIEVYEPDELQHSISCDSNFGGECSCK